MKVTSEEGQSGQPISIKFVHTSVIESLNPIPTIGNGLHTVERLSGHAFNGRSYEHYGERCDALRQNDLLWTEGATVTN